MLQSRWFLSSSVALLAIAMLLAAPSRRVAAEELNLARANAAKLPEANFNLKMPTLGGLQFWSDELVFGEWRIQRNAIMGHYRLLDGDDERRAWGDFVQCRAKLDELKIKRELPPLQGKVVLVLHGIIRSRSSMNGLCGYLRQHGDYTVINVSYASTRDSLDGHARSFAKVIEHLGPEVTEINLVAHSLGNLVIRRYLAGAYRGEEGFVADPRLRRIVMLAPPNQGARMARLFQDTVVMEWVWGQSAVQLAGGWPEVERRLAIPRCEFAILSGGGTEPAGRNVLLDGDDDFIVRVEETRLAGARDFAVVPVDHGGLMNEPQARQYVLRFLQHGYFVSEADRTPIAALPVDAAPQPSAMPVVAETKSP
jgi:pimeloyl-ACP methyl ester carboxylesterase